MKKFVVCLAFFVWLMGTNITVVAAADLSLGLTVSTTQINPGGLVTYNITYGNNTDQVLSDVVVSLSLPLDNGLSFISSSRPVELSADNKPIWRVDDLSASDQGKVISITVSANSNYPVDQIVASASIDASLDGGVVSSSSGLTSVEFVTSEPTKEEETKDDGEMAEDTKQTVTPQVEAENPVDLVATGVNKLKIDQAVGGADLSQFEAVTKWDGRFLTIGLVGLVLILVVGLVAFFLGRKSS
ncbi:MAG: hypothetical protein WC570_05380 [Patescibacteria group bacterium]